MPEGPLTTGVLAPRRCTAPMLNAQVRTLTSSARVSLTRELRRRCDPPPNGFAGCEAARTLAEAVSNAEGHPHALGSIPRASDTIKVWIALTARSWASCPLRAP